MKIYTISDGTATRGARVEKRQIANASEIYVIEVGEAGRGRSTGWVVCDPKVVKQERKTFTFRISLICGEVWDTFMPMEGYIPSSWHECIPRTRKLLGREEIISKFPGEKDNKPADAYGSGDWESPAVVESGILGTTKSGAPKLYLGEEESKEVLVVMRTLLGFRGSNAQTGDKIGEQYLPFPGKIIVSGRIAQGDAGRAGSGTQIIAILKDGDIFREEMVGRLYGSPPERFYKISGGKIIGGVSPEERAASEIF